MEASDPAIVEESDRPSRDLERGRACFDRGAWADARVHLAAADARDALGAADLERLAAATYLRGDEVGSTTAWSRAHDAARDSGEDLHAVRCAFWAAFVLLNRGDLPGGSGWIERGRRLLEGGHGDVVERGYLSYLAGLRSIFEGDVRAARDRFAEAAGDAERFHDLDLEVLARLGQGRAEIRLGQIPDGVALLDEAMIVVDAGEVSPIVVGDTCCTAIEGCQEVFDLPRAQRWTNQLSRWCDEHPDLVAFRGQCLIHRAEILQLGGAWPDAMEEACRAQRRLSRPAGQMAVGAAHYQQGELHRLRGEDDAAESAYEKARRHGREPQPGLALLRLGQDRSDSGAAAIRRALVETEDPFARCRLLPAAVEILVAVDDLAPARRTCRELEELAGPHNSRLLDAVTAYTRGVLEQADGHPGPALESLRRALRLWQELDVPYEVARTRVLIGDACRDLDDAEAAASEWALAREILTDLGASPDLARLEKRAAPDTAEADHGLTSRELEVLRWVASGRTNRAIAEELVISERTVESHVSSVLSKLQVSSRSAATAYAHRHGLA